MPEDPDILQFQEALLLEIAPSENGTLALNDLEIALTEEGATVGLVEAGAEVMVSSPFCITWDGRPRFTWVVAAPSPELAISTVEAIIDAANRGSARLGLPALWGFMLGVCPA